MDPHVLGEYCGIHNDVFATVLGNYQGGHTIGIGKTPHGKGCIMMRVPDAVDHSIFPQTVEINGEAISVIVEGGYQQAYAL